MPPSPRHRAAEATEPPAARSGSAAAPPPSDTVRGIVTVAVAVYLLGLVLTIMANSTSGSSTLVRTLVDRLFAPWMAPVWLDLGFDYRLTHGGPADGDHELEIGPWKGPAAALRRFPGGLDGARADRWRRLARAVAVADDDDRAGLLATAAARGMFAPLGARDLAVRVTRLPPRERGGPQPAAERVYAARVRMVSDEVQLIRDEPREELAPLVPPPGAP